MFHILIHIEPLLITTRALPGPEEHGYDYALILIGKAKGVIFKMFWYSHSSNFWWNKELYCIHWDQDVALGNFEVNILYSPFIFYLLDAL